MYASNGTFCSVTLMGNVGQDPHSINDRNNNCVTFTSLAVDDSYVDRDNNRVERTTWVEGKAFGKQAETMRDHVKKGRKILVMGTLSTRVKDLIDPADNQLKGFTFLEMEIKEWTFADKKPAESNQGGYQNQSQGGHQNQAQNRQQGRQQGHQGHQSQGHQTQGRQQGHQQTYDQNQGHFPPPQQNRRF